MVFINVSPPLIPLRGKTIARALGLYQLFNYLILKLFSSTPVS